MEPIASSIAGLSGMNNEVTREKISLPRRRKRVVNEEGSVTDAKKSVRTAISHQRTQQRKKAKAPSRSTTRPREDTTAPCQIENGSCTDEFFEDLENDPALGSSSTVVEADSKPPRKKTATTVRKRKKKAATTRMVVVEYRDPSLVLLIDRREIGGCRKQAGGDLEAHIRKYSPSMPYDVRTLALGDFVWICQVTEFYREEAIVSDDTMEEPLLQSRKREFVLPWIIERKTLQDLLGSVHGSRYRDQKSRLLRFLKDPSIVFRLGSSAPPKERDDCPLDSVTQSIEPMGILLIEASHDVSLNQPIFHQQYYDLPNDKSARNTVVGAQINSQARDNLHLLQTANLDHTASMLVKLHTALEHKFNQLIPHYLEVVTDGADKSKRLSFLSYGARYKPGATDTVQSLLEQQLRLVPGVTPIIAQVLSQEYRTPANLIGAIQGFHKMSFQERRVLSGVGQRALESLYRHLMNKSLSWVFSTNRVVGGGEEDEVEGRRAVVRPSIKIPSLDDEDSSKVVNNISGPIGEHMSKNESDAEAIRLIQRIRDREAAQELIGLGGCGCGCGGGLECRQQRVTGKVSPDRSNLANVAVRSLGQDENKEPQAPVRRSIISPCPSTESVLSVIRGRSNNNRVSVIEY